MAVIGLVILTGSLLAGVPAQAAPPLEDIKLEASDGVDADDYGFSVDANPGGVVVSGTPLDDFGLGAAYVNEPDGSGGFIETKLSASSGSPGDMFGHSVAISAATGTVAVGAPGEAGEGAVYLYGPDGSGGFTETKIVASDGAVGDAFGHAVAAFSDLIVVGAPAADTSSASSAGKVYLYGPDGLGGFVEVILEASDGASGDEFGLSVAVHGPFVVVGAPSDDDDGAESGSVYVFEDSGVGGFVESKLTASDAAAGDVFGRSVATFEGTVVAGAPGDDADGAESGSVYAYEPDGIGGLTEIKATASDGASGNALGHSVDIFGPVVLAGAPFGDGAEADSGTAYLLEPDGAGGFVDTKLVASDGLTAQEFGFAVSIDGPTIAVGAPSTVSEVLADPGSVYLFVPILCNGLPVTVDIGAGDVPTAGDDVILGTPGDDSISALAGDDTICAGAGDDMVVGGDGDDVVLAGPGADVVAGNAGADTLIGDGGKDRIFGGSGPDVIEGRFGDDLLGGGSGTDIVEGQEGADRITGGSDGDIEVSGGPGNDAVNGGGGPDPVVKGDGGDDTVSGNGGKDIVDGGEGDDEVRGGQNDDTVLGGPGDDMLFGNTGVDVCDGGTAGETTGDTAAANCETILNVP